MLQPGTCRPKGRLYVRIRTAPACDAPLVEAPADGRHEARPYKTGLVASPPRSVSRLPKGHGVLARKRDSLGMTLIQVQTVQPLRSSL
jgi:hypothetical protein